MLRGERVVLRATEREDIKRMHELVNQHIDLWMLADAEWQPAPLVAVEKDFEKHLTDEPKADFVIEVDGKLIGNVGLHTRSINRRSGTVELGISIVDPEYVGKGYGREALTIFLDWAFFVQNHRKIVLTTLGSNERAVRCYAAVGFREEGRQREQEWFNGSYDDVVWMGLLQREWAERRGQDTMRFA